MTAFSTMNKIMSYRQALKKIESWPPYLLANSGLPGPRGNIELAQAVAEEGTKELFLDFLEYDYKKAPTNTPEEFLAFCGTLGLGRLLAEGDLSLWAILKNSASDPRWRMREGVAMALQSLGEVDMAMLTDEMKKWSQGNPREQRAAAAALCEPRLLRDPKHAEQVLDILDQITAGLLKPRDYPPEDIMVLKKGLGYCWSVAVAALPEAGKPLMENWLKCKHKDISWIMKENLSKKRLQRMDAEWVERWKITQLK